MGKAMDHAPKRPLSLGACLVVLSLAGCQKKVVQAPPPPPPPVHVQVVNIGDDNIATTLSCEVTAGGRQGACKVVSCSPGAHIENNTCALDGGPVAHPPKCTAVGGSHQTKRC